MKTPKDYNEALKIIRKQKTKIFISFLLGFIVAFLLFSFLLEVITKGL